MDQEAFEAKVEELTRMAELQPARYRRGVIFWTLLGYVVLSSFLLGAAALVLMMFSLVGLVGYAGSLIAMKVLAKGGWVAAIPVLMLIKTLLTAAFVRIDPPEGRTVTADEFPALFEALDEVANSLSVRRPGTVLLTPDFNAAVVQVPRLGVLPWFRSYLLVGLPLLQTLDPEEFRAVLAHELGHLSAAHGKLGGWIYRVRATWFRIAGTLQNEEVAASGLLWSFFGWYLPRFSAWTFVSSRANEYEADSLAAQATTPAALASALARVELGARAQAEHFETIIHDMTKRTPHAPEDWYQRLGVALQGSWDGREAWLDEARAEQTGVEDTHPSLTDRVNALGLQVSMPGSVEITAAQVLLGEGEQRLLGEFSAVWKSNVQPIWARQFHKYQDEAKLLEDMDARYDSLTHEEQLEWAGLVENHRPDQALEAWAALFEQQSDHVAVLFHYGRVRVERGDGGGVELLERAADADEGALLPAARLAVGFLRSKGREEEADRWIARVNGQLEAHAALQDSRHSLDADSELVPHELPPAALEHIKTVLRNCSGIRGAWVWRKVVAGDPVYVIALRVVAVDALSTEEVFANILETFLPPEIDALWHMVNVDVQSRSLRAKLVSSEDAELAV